MSKTENSFSRKISEIYNPPNFHAIKKFDDIGNLVFGFSQKGEDDGKFLHAHGIGTDSKGYIYITDSGNVHFREKFQC